MSRWSHVTETDIWKALAVQKYGRDGVDATDYLAHRSRADPFEVDA
jgi:hypothetical protein